MVSFFFFFKCYQNDTAQADDRDQTEPQIASGQEEDDEGDGHRQSDGADSANRQAVLHVVEGQVADEPAVAHAGRSRIQLLMHPLFHLDG